MAQIEVSAAIGQRSRVKEGQRMEVVVQISKCAPVVGVGDEILFIPARRDTERFWIRSGSGALRPDGSAVRWLPEGDPADCLDGKGCAVAWDDLAQHIRHTVEQTNARQRMEYEQRVNAAPPRRND